MLQMNAVYKDNLLKSWGKEKSGSAAWMHTYVLLGS